MDSPDEEQRLFMSQDDELIVYEHDRAEHPAVPKLFPYRQKKKNASKETPSETLYHESPSGRPDENGSQKKSPHSFRPQNIRTRRSSKVQLALDADVQNRDEEDISLTESLQSESQPLTSPSTSSTSKLSAPDHHHHTAKVAKFSAVPSRSAILSPRSSSAISPRFIKTETSPKAGFDCDGNDRPLRWLRSTKTKRSESRKTAVRRAPKEASKGIISTQGGAKRAKSEIQQSIRSSSRSNNRRRSIQDVLTIANQRPQLAKEQTREQSSARKRRLPSTMGSGAQQDITEFSEDESANYLALSPGKLNMQANVLGSVERFRSQPSPSQLNKQTNMPRSEKRRSALSAKMGGPLAGVYAISRRVSRDRALFSNSQSILQSRIDNPRMRPYAVMTIISGRYDDSTNFTALCYLWSVMNEDQELHDTDDNTLQKSQGDAFRSPSLRKSFVVAMFPRRSAENIELSVGRTVQVYSPWYILNTQKYPVPVFCCAHLTQDYASINDPDFPDPPACPQHLVQEMQKAVALY